MWDGDVVTSGEGAHRVGSRQRKKPTKWTYFDHPYLPTGLVGRWESDDDRRTIVYVYKNRTFHACVPYWSGFPEPEYGCIGIVWTLRGARKACE